VLRGGALDLYSDTLGRVNYDILKPTPDADTTAAGFTIARIDAGEVRIEGLDARYTDAAALIRAAVKGLSTEIGAAMEGGLMSVSVAANDPFDVDFSMGKADSLLKATLRGATLDAACSMQGDNVEADIRALGAAGVTLGFGGETYITDAPVLITAGAAADMAARGVDIRAAVLKLADLEIALDGKAALNPAGGIDTDMRYKFNEWPLEDVLALVPPSLAHYLDGIEAGGVVSSEGTVRGLYDAVSGSMPKIDAGVLFDRGNVSYPAMLPWPLTQVRADLAISTDLTDGASGVTIRSLAAQTPRSTLRASGSLDHLFSDPHAALTADLDADLADAAPFIPDSLKLTATGRIAGEVKADVRMSQLAKMEFDRMKVSARLTATNFDALYDTISIAAPSAKLDFELPNANPATRHTAWVKARLDADRLDAGFTTDSTCVEIRGANLALETSSLLDTVNIPAVALDFAFDRLAARIDTVRLEARSQWGKLSTEPHRRRSTSAQRIEVVWNGTGGFAAGAGGMRAAVDSIDIDASILYDTSRPDLWQQLSPRGRVSAGGVRVEVPTLGYPVELPRLAMDFTPRQFHVEGARMLLDESDFSLRGTIDNIDAWFRGDDILRGEFDFSSPVTNVTQLLALTSGLGDAQLEAEKATDAAPADQFTGPYMVPKGVDLTLHADIGNVLWQGESLLSNVRGDVQVRDGALYITPEVAFTSPVTTGNIQLMYRTPSKNNLFAGVGIHLHRIDMQELVRVIPDLDELMPMLRGFSGRGEFHCAVEGYMDSTYRFKMSTLRGAGSLSAVDLALKDEELFRRIAVLLKYRDQGTLRVDSMRAEFTVLRNEINLYPFLLKVDRYGAVIGGRHSMGGEFDYNISLVESPLPFRVAVDVTGSASDLQFKVFSKSRYPDFYRPRYEGVVENRQMELRNLIRNSLLAGRKEEEN
jgi:hypothetical protein